MTTSSRVVDVGKRATDDLLARPERVHVRGVEEVDAELERPGDERPARLFVERPRMVAASRLAVAHASEAHP